MKRKISGILIIACMLLSLWDLRPEKVSAATAGIDAGVSWTISERVLTLSAAAGTDGKMRAYSYARPAPWQSQLAGDRIDRVVVDGSVTELGAFAFCGEGLHLKEMKIFGGATVIPSHFCESAAIDTLYLGSGIRELENGAFYGVVKTVYIAESVEKLPLSAFGINHLSGNGTVSYVGRIYGYTGSPGQQYAELYPEAVEAARSAIKMWKDGRKYVLDSNCDGREDENPAITFTALDQVSVLKKAYVSSGVTVSIGKTQPVKINMPAGLTQTSKYSGMEGEVKASFQSKNKKIASVNAKGVVTGKKKGTTTIITTLSLQNGTKKKFTTKVTVK